MDRHSDRLGIVAHRASAHRQQQVSLVRPSDPNALIQFGQGGVWHDSGDLRHLFSLLVQNGPHGVIDTVALDGAPAVDEDHPVPIFGQLLVEPLQRLLSKVQLGGVAVSKISQHDSSSLYLTAHGPGPLQGGMPDSLPRSIHPSGKDCPCQSGLFKTVDPPGQAALRPRRDLVILLRR